MKKIIWLIVIVVTMICIVSFCSKKDNKNDLTSKAKKGVAKDTTTEDLSDKVLKTFTFVGDIKNNQIINPEIVINGRKYPFDVIYTKGNKIRTNTITIVEPKVIEYNAWEIILWAILSCIIGFFLCIFFWKD